MSGLAWAIAEIIVVKINLSPFSQIKRIVKSIKENGFDQEKPVDVWRNPKTGHLEIQDGHHRTEAAKKAGLDKIPVSIWE